MSEKRRVAIITGNSNSGKYCIEELYEKFQGKLHVRAAFRSEDKAKPFREKYPDLDILTGVDASKPETLNVVFENCEAALIVTPHDPTRDFSLDAGLNENMIHSAVSNGVKYIVLVASWTVKDCARMSIISSRFKSSEELLSKLGEEKNLKYTVLRGGCFMENTLYMFKDAIKNEKAVKFVSVNQPMVYTRDIGKSAAACLASDNYDIHHGKYYEMNGPEILTGHDVAKTFTKVLGHEIKFIELPREALKHIPEGVAQIWNYCLDEGESAIPFTDDVKKLTGQNATFEQFVNDHKNFFM